MPHVFILRHGPVYYNDNGKELLDERRFKKVLPKIMKHITKYCGIDTIYTSPVLRCELTGEILADQFHKCDVRVRKELYRRPNGSDEPRCCAHKRGYEFGNRVNYNALKKGDNIAIITHSSMYQSVVEGVIGYKLDSKEFLDANHDVEFISGDRVYINDTAVTVYDVKKKQLCDFNVQMYCRKCRK